MVLFTMVFYKYDYFNHILFKYIQFKRVLHLNWKKFKVELCDKKKIVKYSYFIELELF